MHTGAGEPRYDEGRGWIEPRLRQPRPRRRYGKGTTMPAVATGGGKTDSHQNFEERRYRIVCTGAKEVHSDKYDSDQVEFAFLVPEYDDPQTGAAYKTRVWPKAYWRDDPPEKLSRLARVARALTGRDLTAEEFTSMAWSDFDGLAATAVIKLNDSGYPNIDIMTIRPAQAAPPARRPPAPAPAPAPARQVNGAGAVSYPAATAPAQRGQVAGPTPMFDADLEAAKAAPVATAQPALPGAAPRASDRLIGQVEEALGDCDRASALIWFRDRFGHDYNPDTLTRDEGMALINAVEDGTIVPF